MLDENTSVPYAAGKTMVKKVRLKKQRVGEIEEEVFANGDCFVWLLYNFIMQYFNKKTDNGYYNDCPNYEDLRVYIKNNKAGYKRVKRFVEDCINEIN